MSGKKPKKNQRLGSSRRYKNHNRDAEEKENEDGIPDPEDHRSEHSQAWNEPSLLQSDQAVITDSNTSDPQQSLHSQSQDLRSAAEITSKKRKMGSTRKPRNITFKGVYEDEEEHMTSEGVSDEQVRSAGASIKEDCGEDEENGLSDCAGKQSSQPEISILQKQHLEIIQNEEDQHLEIVLQNKPMDSSSELKSLKRESGQDLLQTSPDFSECRFPFQESNEALQIRHESEIFSETDATEPSSMINSPPHGNREERLEGEISQRDLTEYTASETTEDQSSLDFIIIGKEGDKEEREDVATPMDYAAEDRRPNEVPEIQPDDKAREEDENAGDLDYMEDILKPITESNDTFKSTELTEDQDKEVGVSGDRTDNNVVEWGSATNLNPVSDPDRRVISPLNLRDEAFSSELKFQPDSEVKSFKQEHCDLSEFRSWIAESSADEDGDKVYYEETYRAVGTEKVVENDDRKSTASTQVLFSEAGSTDELHFVPESCESQCEETETSRQKRSRSQNNESERQCSDEMLEKVINDRSETEAEAVVEVVNNDIKEETNVGSTVSYTEERCVSVLVDDEQQSVDTFMNEMRSDFADEASILSEVLDIQSFDAERIDPVHTASNTIQFSPENMSEECRINPTHSESEAERFKSTFLTEHELTLSPDDAGAENLSIFHSEKNNIRETQRNSDLLTYEGEQKETNSLNIRQPEEINENVMEIDENVINAVVKNENSSQEAPQQTSTQLVSTNLQCGVDDRQDEETVKDIYTAVNTTHATLSDENEALVDREDSQSRTERDESIKQNQEATGDKDVHQASMEEHNRNSVVDVENTNTEFQTQRKKKKKFGSTRRPHGGNQPHAEGEEREAEITEETEPNRIITQDSTLHIITESHNPVHEASQDINDAPVTSEQQEIIQSQHEIMKEETDEFSSALLNEGDEIHSEVCDQINTDIIEQEKKVVVNEVNDAESKVFNEHKMAADLQNHAFLQAMFQAVKKNCDESPDDAYISSTCGPVEVIPEMQVMSDTEIITEDIIAVEDPSNTEQLTVLSTFVQIHESKSHEEHLKFSSSEKKRKIGSTRKSLRGQIHNGDQKNKSEAINQPENIPDQNTDENISSIGVIREDNNDSKEKIKSAEHSQQYTLCEFSSQNNDPNLTTNKHPSPAAPHREVMADEQESVENVENKNTQIQTQRKKSGSTRKQHEGHQAHSEGEEREAEITEEIHIVAEAESSDMNTDRNDAMSEQYVDCNESENVIQHADPSFNPMEFISETHVRLDMSVSAEHQKSNVSESECCVVHTEELKLDRTAMQNTEQTGDSNSGRKKKFGSTRKSLRITKEKENILETTTEETTPISENNDAGTPHLKNDPQSIQTLSKTMHLTQPDGDKSGLTCRIGEEGACEHEARGINVDTDSRHVGDIDRPYLKSEIIEDRFHHHLNLCVTETETQELQIHNKLNLSERSLLSEIAIYLNENTLNTAATTDPNISRMEEMSDEPLQLPSSQNPQIHTEPKSTVRRKMGSSRKISRKEHEEKLSNEDEESEHENISMEKSKNSETKIKTESTGESAELVSEVQGVPQINESRTQATEHPLPQVRRKFGSKRTVKGRSVAHDDYQSNQKNTDQVQSTKDGIMSGSISQPGPAARPGTDEGETHVSTETGLVFLDNMEKSLPFVGSTGGRTKIDFDFEQFPDFEQVVYNVVMVGNSSVGKTSYIKRLQIGEFIPDYGATIGVDTFIQTVKFSNRTVKLYMWDTAGQERYHSITKQVFNKAQGLLLMYDITSAETFHAIRSWISQVQEKAPPEVIMMLLGNKSDCVHREVQRQDGENLAKEYDIHFMECSAATGENVLNSVKTLAWLLVKHGVRRADEYTTLQPKPQTKKSGCC